MGNSENHGKSWKIMEIHGKSWKFLEIHGILGISDFYFHSGKDLSFSSQFKYSDQLRPMKFNGILSQIPIFRS